MSLSDVLFLVALGFSWLALARLYFAWRKECGEAKLLRECLRRCEYNKETFAGEAKAHRITIRRLTEQLAGQQRESLSQPAERHVHVTMHETLGIVFDPLKPDAEPPKEKPISLLRPVRRRMR